VEGKKGAGGSGKEKATPCFPILAAVACAETGMSAHLLLRGERPLVLTGYTLMCHMYGHVTYIPRSEYANRDAMFAKHVDRVSRLGGAKTGVIKEGAGDAVALLGEDLS
jgi:hypothetical protein